jgi:hypothetical protein
MVFNIQITQVQFLRYDKLEYFRIFNTLTKRALGINIIEPKPHNAITILPNKVEPS